MRELRLFSSEGTQPGAGLKGTPEGGAAAGHQAGAVSSWQEGARVSCSLAGRQVLTEAALLVCRRHGGPTWRSNISLG